MVFSSLLFLYAFFPLSMLVYALCRGRTAQNVSLLVFSLIFYAWAEPKYVLLLMSMAFISWICALMVERGRAGNSGRFWLAVTVIADIALIGYFKYAAMLCGIFGPVPKFIREIALPIGISFYTFQLLTYVVDVYRGEAQAQISYWNVLLYAALFHQCVAGPIVRYKTIAQELFYERKPEIAAGVSRFCVGLSKKVLLANPCGALADGLILSADAASNMELLAENIRYFEGLSVLGAWVGVVAYSLHIYLDFSAYSDMAIGMGKMLGLHYPENFNYPYISRSVTEFWRRWHISLGTFFRDYVYIPLGGSRVGVLRSVLNTFVVWALTGLWHGASWNFVVWGLWFFAFLMLERLFLRRWLDRVPVLSNLYLLFAVMLGWVIFRFSSLELGMKLIGSLLGLNGNPLSGFADEIQLQCNCFLLAAAVVASTPLLSRLRRKAEATLSRSALAPVWDLAVYGLIPVLLLLLSTANLVGDSYNPFLYFQF